MSEMAAWPYAQGEMADRVRAFDWAATRLGPMADWPVELRCAVELVLDSGFPMIVLWGASLIQIYNDGYRDLMDGKRPDGLGQPTAECWPEAWHLTKPIFERVWQGERVTLPDAVYPPAREGEVREACFNLGYSPLRVAGGVIGGVLVTLTETTAQRRAERELRERAARLRAFVVASSDIVYRMSADWSQMYELEGKGSLADTMRTSSDWVERYIPEDHRAQVRDIISRAIATRSVLELEHPVLAPDGSLAWMLSRAVPVLDEEGGIVEWLGAGSDVTERRRTQDALRESEERFREFAEASGDTLWIVDVASGKLEYLNPAFEPMFGASRAHVLADIASWRELVHPDDRAAVAEGLPKLYRGERVVLDYRVVRPCDGQVRWIHDTGFPLRDAHGRISRVAGIAQDWTEARRISEAEAESRRRWQSLIEGVPQLVWTAVDGGHWTWSSPQWTDMTGLSLEQSLGHGWAEALHSEDREATLANWRGAVERGEFEADYRLHDVKEGRWRAFQSRATPVRDEAGTIVEWLGTSNDVDDLMQLRRHEATLLAELQHRVRNTLAVIRSIVRRTAETSDTVEDYVMHLDGRLGAFARTQAYVTRDPNRGIDLGEIVADELMTAGMGVSDQVEVDGPEVRLSPKMADSLGLALHELATNSIKYGALGTSDGRLATRWHYSGEGQSRRLHLDWRETLATPLRDTKPARRGFGTRLLEQTLAYELDAEVALRFEPDGAHCVIALPCPA